MNSTKDELETIAKELGEKIVKGIYISVATDKDFDTDPLEKWLVQKLEALLEERERLARVDILKTILESYGKALYLPIRKVKAMLSALQPTKEKG